MAEEMTTTETKTQSEPTTTETTTTETKTQSEPTTESKTETQTQAEADAAAKAEADARAEEEAKAQAEADAKAEEEARLKRIEGLRSSIDRADVSVAEKFRAVLEAYNIELQYGRGMDTYRGTIDIGGNERLPN